VLNSWDFISNGGFLELFTLGIAELNTMLERHEVSARDICVSVYKRIEAVEDRIRAM
jgi:hypothetical protein